MFPIDTQIPVAHIKTKRGRSALLCGTLF